MSCFGGKTYEYDEMLLDRFDGINLSSAAYFLSHCHADHMVGLESHELSKRFFWIARIFSYIVLRSQHRSYLLFRVLHTFEHS